MSFPTKLSRQRFFEIKHILEDFNNDRISLSDFLMLISSQEAQSYELMLKIASNNLEWVEFDETKPDV